MSADSATVRKCIAIVFAECQPNHGDLFGRIDDKLRALLDPAAESPEPHRVLCKHFRAARLPDAVEVEPRAWVCAACAAKR